MRYEWMVVLGLGLSAGCSRSPESALVRGAADAMGGASKILSVDTLILEGSGENWNLGQNQSPQSELPKLDVTELKRVIDFKGGRWRQEAVRTPTYLTGNPAPQRQVLGVAGDVAYNVSPSGTATRASARTASDRSSELYHHPIGILRAALAPQPSLANARKEGGTDAVDVTTSSGATYSLYLDESTKLPVKIVSKTSHPLLGDVLMETRFSDYAETDGLKLPTVITSLLDGNTLAAIRIKATTLNGEAGDLEAPAEASSAQAEPPAAIEVAEAGKGIWYLTGQSHHSILAEFSDHLVLVEVPNETRTLAVIAKARELRPYKPLTHAVVTHHHFDHSGGIRAAVSEGLTIIAHAAAADFIKDIVARPHTLEPDALARNPKPLNLQTVDGELLLEDGAMKLALYPISGSAHADTLLMAHFPQAGGFLVEADVYSPPAPGAPPPPAFPFAANLAQNCQERKLKIASILPIHGRMVPMSDMMSVAVPAAPTSGQ
jgi:glyoxylase-like metal-dependent hydrolase (beta-lactamase superfamily II)